MTFDTKAEAKAWGTDTEAQLARGTLPAKPDKAAMTVKQLLEKYMEEESPKKRSGARDKFKAKPLIDNLGAYLVHTLTPRALADYKRQRLALRAPQTVTHELNMLHRAYVLGVQEWGLVLPNGIPKVRRPELPRGRDRRVSDKELAALVEHSDSLLLGQLIRFAVETAMRRGEIVGLDWSNVNLGRKSALLARTKTDTPRTVPLSSGALAVLLETPEVGRTGPVFPIEPASVSQAFKRAAKRAELPAIRFHDLRHEATSRLFERGLNVIEVARITGHKTLAMLDRYTHLDVRHLLDKLG